MSQAMAASGSEVLFTNNIGKAEKILVEGYFIQKHPALPTNTLNIAKADLNEDGLYEFLVKSRCGEHKEFCHYTILADSDGKIIELGDIEAQGIMLGGGYTKGIRNIIVYKNSINDYEHSVYVWEPLARQYIMKE